jgi:hypothetical protein
MTGKNKTRMVGWHPKSADLAAWIDAQIERRGGGRGAQSDILEEAMSEYRARHDQEQTQRKGAGTMTVSQSEHYEGFKAHNLGFLDGTNAAKSGDPSKPHRHRQFTDREWAEYQRGWDEALESCEIENG